MISEATLYEYADPVVACKVGGRGESDVFGDPHMKQMVNLCQNLEALGLRRLDF